ncbi:MAG: hypothetical protein HC774_03395 [Sphingomonadales bacterium]|nr:hypothetical protein [Sphingomonadales bacterium]
MERFVFFSYAHKPGLARELNAWLHETTRRLPAGLPLGTVHPGDPDVVDVVVRTRNTAYLFARKVGQTNVFFFDQKGQQILNVDLEVALDRRPRRARIARDPRDVDDLAVEKRGHRKEAGEPGRLRTSASAWASTLAIMSGTRPHLRRSSRSFWRELRLRRDVRRRSAWAQEMLWL